MATYLAFHEVDDVEHWLNSGKREEAFGPHGFRFSIAARSASRVRLRGPSVTFIPTLGRMRWGE
jgi:hypothetical protein